MDEQRRVRMVIFVRLLAVHGEQRELRDELQRLPQYVLFGNVVGARVVGVEGEHAPREHVHHVLRRRLHDDIAHERGRQLAEIRQQLAEPCKVLFCGQVAEQEQEGRFFKIETPPLHAFHEVADVDAAVIQLPVYGHFVPVFVLAEGNDLGDLRQAAHDAVAVHVA